MEFVKMLSNFCFALSIHPLNIRSNLFPLTLLMCPPCSYHLFFCVFYFYSVCMRAHVRIFEKVSTEIFFPFCHNIICAEKSYRSHSNWLQFHWIIATFFFYSYIIHISVMYSEDKENEEKYTQPFQIISFHFVFLFIFEELIKIKNTFKMKTDFKS